MRNFVGGDSSFGASTITQQLIKNLSKEDSVTVNRKVQEIFRALAVEKRYTKEEIMEWYLNTIYLGQGCYGVQSAAQVYFGKDVSELSTAECACIVGITNNPSLYDPYYFPNNNRKRQTTILEEMYKQGYIETEADLAAAEGEEMLFHNGRYDEKEYTCGSCGFTGYRAARMCTRRTPTSARNAACRTSPWTTRRAIPTLSTRSTATWSRTSRRPLTSARRRPSASC